MASKAAIVTGGAQGIGKGIVRMLLKDGYKVHFLRVKRFQNGSFCF